MAATDSGFERLSNGLGHCSGTEMSFSFASLEWMCKFRIRSLIRDNGFNFVVPKKFFRFYLQSRSLPLRNNLASNVLLLL